jgi:hypothetical protein
MAIFEFTLKFSLPDNEADPDVLVEKLAAAGCDDALIGSGQPGRIALTFDRKADSAFAAVSSAVLDVRGVIPDARLVEAVPDLVGLTDVADIVQCSRQYMRKLMLNSGASFPVPVHEGKVALWHLSKVLVWLRDNKQYQFDEKLLDIAQINMQFNMAREAQEVNAELQPRILKLVS